MSIGERLKSIREPTSREAFCEIVGVSKNTIVNYEKGSRTPDAEFLNRIVSLHPEINPAWLLTGEGPRERGPLVNDELRHQAAEAAGEYSEAPPWHLALTRAVAGSSRPRPKGACASWPAKISIPVYVILNGGLKTSGRRRTRSGEPG